MIEPVQADDALLADIERASGERPESLHLWWLGQSGFLAGVGGRFLLFDPYLSDSLTEKYAATDKPHTRMTRRVVAPERLGFVDAVTSTHNHTDHLDAATLNPLRGANPALRLAIPEANRAFVRERLGWPDDALMGLTDGVTAQVGAWRITGIAAAHEGPDTDDAGRHVYLGYVAQLGPWTLYHSGDCVPYPGLDERLAPFDIDVALLPINGRLPQRRVSGNFWGDEAARLAKAIRARTAVPCHYELFSFNTEPPDLFVETCQALGQGYAVLRAGERLSLD